MGRREKLSSKQKKCIANLKLHGKKFRDLAGAIGVCEATARKGAREGDLLNMIDKLAYQNRSLLVQNEILKSSVTSKRKRSSGHS